MRRGFFVGRFQPFHDGHLHVVEQIAADVDELVVGVGSAGASHSVRNPFTAGERVVMLERALEALDLRTYVVPIEDIERNAVWVSHVRSICPPFDVAYSNNPLVVRLFEEAGFEVRGVDLYDRENLEGTEIRRRMVADEPWREFVPAPVVDVVEEVDGVGRIRQVDQDDGSSHGDGGTDDGSDDAPRADGG